MSQTTVETFKWDAPLQGLKEGTFDGTIKIPPFDEKTNGTVFDYIYDTGKISSPTKWPSRYKKTESPVNIGDNEIENMIAWCYTVAMRNFAMAPLMGCPRTKILIVGTSGQPTAPKSLEARRVISVSMNYRTAGKAAFNPHIEYDLNVTAYDMYIGEDRKAHAISFTFYDDKVEKFSPNATILLPNDPTTGIEYPKDVAPIQVNLKTPDLARKAAMACVDIMSRITGSIRDIFADQTATGLLVGKFEELAEKEGKYYPEFMKTGVIPKVEPISYKGAESKFDYGYPSTDVLYQLGTLLPGQSKMFNTKMHFKNEVWAF